MVVVVMNLGLDGDDDDDIAGLRTEKYLSLKQRLKILKKPTRTLYHHHQPQNLSNL